MLSGQKKGSVLKLLKFYLRGFSFYGIKHTFKIRSNFEPKLELQFFII